MGVPSQRQKETEEKLIEEFENNIHGWSVDRADVRYALEVYPEDPKTFLDILTTKRRFGFSDLRPGNPEIRERMKFEVLNYEKRKWGFK